ncbi:MAG: hypothetical protein K6L81_01760 [Agarilytica sp.]
MSDTKLRRLKAELEEIDHCVGYREGRREEKYDEIVSVVGACPRCKNHHYPHCKTK